MKAAVFLANGFEEVEALTPVDYLRRAGVDVAIVAVLSDKGSLMVKGSHNVAVQADMTLEAFVKSKAASDLVIMPGGMPGAKNLGECKAVIEIIKATFNAGKLVAAICAAPAVVLSKTGVLSGREWTCYPGMERQLSLYCGSVDTLMKGSTYRKDAPFVTSGTVVTARGPGCAEQFSMELVRLLCGNNIAKKIQGDALLRSL